ncbi:spore coat protein U domain-containing protein [Ramlibacter tataouinensis]|uniref:Spore coat protein U/FanG domain-containing protein n=1 Tax=Ramlibacter tataouinensis (strain ATCC BAA-407 / DSM 14655 / LMG 21543 / TTB310) TaxID=365046 RepID=F5Y053_RAMTT|nr:spore coat protein U domain-containing protein [Ramlibacter tataouinensis]AEG94602.1 hypothetical protein Rta_34890 [Ramlibacter tataouinensis TTB310]
MNRCQFWSRVAASLLLFAGAPAQAAISCSLSSSGFTTVYSENITAANSTVGTVTLTCTRSNLADDPTVFNYSLRADDGQQASNGINRARLNNSNGNGSSNFIGYDLWRDPACSTMPWGGGLLAAGSAFNGTVNFGTAATATASHTQTFHACVPPRQNVRAGTFTDVVNLLACNQGTSLFACLSAPAPVVGILTATIINSDLCQFTAPPGDVVFHYASFQAGPATASATYTVRCTSGVRYTASLDATTGTLQGLNYGLALSNTGQVEGTGLPQTFTINGSIPAGQAGTCTNATCPPASQARTLTITY